MNTEAILKRRSIRKYRSEPVDDDLIRQVLLAGMAAPSAVGTEPWVFVVIRDPAMLARVPEAHPYARMVPEATFAILVCHDERIEKGADWYVQDCAAASENLLVAASALGLGAVWLGVHPVPDLVARMRELVGAPEQVVPLCLISIGYPAEKKPRADRYEEERVHWERW